MYEQQILQELKKTNYMLKLLVSNSYIRLTDEISESNVETMRHFEEFLKKDK